MDDHGAEIVRFYKPDLGLIWSLNATKSIILRRLEDPTLNSEAPPGLGWENWFSRFNLAARYMRALHDAETASWEPLKAPSAQSGTQLDMFWFDRDYDKHHPENPLQWLWLSRFDDQPWSPDDLRERPSNESMIVRSDSNFPS
jgi:hypothetical protein